MRNLKNFLRLLFAALLIVYGLNQAFAAESQKPPFSGTWAGDAIYSKKKGGTEREDIEVVFHVMGNPPVLKSISYTRKDSIKGMTEHFEVDGAKLKFWTGPKDDSGRGMQLWNLELKDGVLKGTLVGPTPGGAQQLRYDIVLRTK